MPSSMEIVRRFFPQVQTVKDARRVVRIEVQKSDTTKGQNKDHAACAMARACKRALHLDGAIVSLGRAYLIKGQTATRYQVPQAVSREIVSFDRGSGFAPGLYTLYKPGSLKTRQRSGNQGGPRSRTRIKAKHVTVGVRAPLSA